MALLRFAQLAHAIFFVAALFVVLRFPFNFIGVLIFVAGLILSLGTMYYAKRSATAHAFTAAVYLGSVAAYSGAASPFLIPVALVLPTIFAIFMDSKPGRTRE